MFKTVLVGNNENQEPKKRITKQQCSMLLVWAKMFVNMFHKPALQKKPSYSLTIKSYTNWS